MQVASVGCCKGSSSRQDYSFCMGIMRRCSEMSHLKWRKNVWSIVTFYYLIMLDNFTNKHVPEACKAS